MITVRPRRLDRRGHARRHGESDPENRSLSLGRGDERTAQNNPPLVRPDRVLGQMSTPAMVKDAPASGGGFVFGRRVSLLVSAGVVSHTLWTSAAPALTYGLYAREWHLTHTVTAGIFAIYPIVVVVVLVGFGGISDQIGRRATMLAGLFASLVGALSFAIAPDVWWVFGGRALMGIGVGLTLSPSTAAILEFSSPERAKSAASVTM